MAGNKELRTHSRKDGGSDGTVQRLFATLSGSLVGELFSDYVAPYLERLVSYIGSGSAKSGKDGQVDRKTFAEDATNIIVPVVLDNLFGNSSIAGSAVSGLASELDIGKLFVEGFTGVDFLESMKSVLDVGWAGVAAGTYDFFVPGASTKSVKDVFSVTLALQAGHKGVDLVEDFYQLLGLLPTDEEKAAMDKAKASIEELRNAPQVEKDKFIATSSSTTPSYMFGDHQNSPVSFSDYEPLSFMPESLSSFASGMLSEDQDITSMLSENFFKQAFMFIPAEARRLGDMSVEGFIEGFESGNSGFGTVIDESIDVVKDKLDSHSPSKVFMQLGAYSAEGFIDGLSSIIGDTGIVASGVVDAMSGGLSSFSSPQGNASGEDSDAKGDETTSWLTDFGTAISGGTSQLLGLFSSVSSVNAILNPMSTIMTSMMEVLEPVMNEVLSPLVGILTTVGTLFGNVLAPALQILTPVIKIVSEGFVWLYNKILVPVGNGFITVFNAIYNAVAWVYNKIAWLWGGHLDSRALDAGHLQAISTDDLAQSGSSYTGAGKSGSTGSSTSVNSYRIEVYQTIEGNVIGDGGMAAIGEFFVQAVQEYYGSGGKIEFITATR